MCGRFITGADEFLVRWTGESSPNTTIASYDVRYNFKDGSWTLWQSQTQGTQATFTNLKAEDGVYCFEVRATDSAGRTSNYMGRQCIAVDREPPFMEPRMYLPVAANNGGY